MSRWWARAGLASRHWLARLPKTLESRRRTVRFVLGTQTGCAVPLGAFYWSVTVDAAHEPAAMLAAAQKTLEQEENLVVVVDDAQLLDPLSATLVYQLAASGSARLIVMIRSGDAVPDAVTALWKERLLLSLHIETFTREQTGELARAVLGGDVDTRLINELHRPNCGQPAAAARLAERRSGKWCVGADGDGLATSRCAAWRPRTLRSARVSAAIVGAGGIGGGRGLGDCGGAGLGDPAWALRCRRGGTPGAPWRDPAGCRRIRHGGAAESPRSWLKRQSDTPVWCVRDSSMACWHNNFGSKCRHGRAAVEVA